MKKRGMVSPVFKYIMALITGTMFLLFFINFGLQYMKTQESFDAYRLTSGFDDILSALGSSIDSETSYSFPLTRIILEPDKDGKNRYILSAGKSTKSIPSYKIVFAPKDLTGKSLSILTKRWYMPYGIDNFFYLTNERYKYFLVYNDETKNLVYDIAGPDDEVTPEISKKFGIETVDENTLLTNIPKIEKFQTPTFVLFQENVNLEQKLNSISNAKVRIINLNEKDNFGEILFEDGQKIPFIGKPMLIGAIFAENSKTYDYSTSMALNKLGVITKIYQEKLRMIAQKPQFFTCNQYTLIKKSFDTLISLTRSYEKDPNEYINLVEVLEETNQVLGGDCPEIF
ncbi:hypothetical protein COV16_00210 [Candidatus Woesearchaeota archaeon CG10_big_fil_rev_8_21_14_0_10_34_8]|jgi:hypothetical protein|nr:MAG: hypothetical protein COV16_00210 [Candidatus Woesearchaeota archaeon CG10_big_fil_rev_8_21_14_0_10_34_8]